VIVPWNGRIYITFPIPLKAYGFHAVTDVRFEPTGDPEVDLVLGQAARTITRGTNPTVVDATAGSLQNAACLDGVAEFPRPW
jgi:hypothetical protein